MERRRFLQIALAGLLAPWVKLPEASPWTVVEAPALNAFIVYKHLQSPTLGFVVTREMLEDNIYPLLLDRLKYRLPLGSEVNSAAFYGKSILHE